MLVTEDVDVLKRCSLDGVDETIANHIDLDGLPLRAERVLRNSHYDCTAGHLPLYIPLHRTGEARCRRIN
jgi:hypothetical protein